MSYSYTNQVYSLSRREHPDYRGEYLYSVDVELPVEVGLIHHDKVLLRVSEEYGTCPRLAISQALEEIHDMARALAEAYDREEVGS